MQKLYKNISVSNASDQPVSSKTYRGLSTINPDSNGFNLYDINLIKQDLINHLNIRQGEKLENPTFGTIIWDVLYEPLTDELKDAIVQNITEIVNYDPRINVNQIQVSSFESGIQVECDLVYLPYSISESLRFRFDEAAGIN